MAKSFEIVGVVKNANYFDMRKDVETDDLHSLSGGFNAFGVSICVRTSGKPEAVTNAIRREMAGVDSACRCCKP